MKYKLPKLPYAYNALEPFIDAKTMEIHLTKHHQAYVINLNAVLAKYPQFTEEKLEDLWTFGNMHITSNIRTGARNISRPGGMY